MREQVDALPQSLLDFYIKGYRNSVYKVEFPNSFDPPVEWVMLSCPQGTRTKNEKTLKDFGEFTVVGLFGDGSNAGAALGLDPGVLLRYFRRVGTDTSMKCLGSWPEGDFEPDALEGSRTTLEELEVMRAAVRAAEHFMRMADPIPEDFTQALLWLENGGG